jgi:hypothetical protein
MRHIEMRPAKLLAGWRLTTSGRLGFVPYSCAFSGEESEVFVDPTAAVGRRSPRTASSAVDQT